MLYIIQKFGVNKIFYTHLLTKAAFIWFTGKYSKDSDIVEYCYYLK